MWPIAHAGFVGRWLRGRGVRLAVVHSGPGSDDRELALRGLASGELDAVCAVDLLSEGIDVPLVDRVLMLRPSESPVVVLDGSGELLDVTALHTAPVGRILGRRLPQQPAVRNNGSAGQQLSAWSCNHWPN